MTDAGWTRVLDQATAMGAREVQFIGGEPTLHRGLPMLIEHALGCGLAVEVYSNLVHVTDELWSVFERPGVSLATSYYSDDPVQHAAITKRPTYARTKTNIARAVERGIPIRAGVIDLGGGQHARQAQDELVGLGVPSVGYDTLRHIGRGRRGEDTSVDQLCGQCGNGIAAISPMGEVWPCVFSRWLAIGNVLDTELDQLLSSRHAGQIRATLRAGFGSRISGQACQPNCGPNCNPISCGPRCEPMTPPCAPKQCPPLDEFCSPNYPGPGRPCSPRSDPCRPMKCRLRGSSW